MKLFNADHSAVVVDPDLPAIQPGESHDFTDDQIEAGISGVWSADAPTDPAAEASSRRRRNQPPAEPAEAPTDPAEPGETKE